VAGAGVRSSEENDCQIGLDRRSHGDGFRMNKRIAVTAARESRA
jgi:hypothetical protein